jgi:predicted DNA-binding protein with PD1-like motif
MHLQVQGMEINSQRNTLLPYYFKKLGLDAGNVLVSFCIVQAARWLGRLRISRTEGIKRMVTVRFMRKLTIVALVICCLGVYRAAFGQTLNDAFISPSRPVPTGKAPGMQIKLVKDTPDEKVYVVIFHKGDEALSGLTDFAMQHDVQDAHFTAIGAVSGATLAWLDVPKRIYHRIAVAEQVEVLSLIGDVAAFNGKPVVHMHAVLGRKDGSTIGGHVFELEANPTLEVFVTVESTPLKKRPDDASGMKLIDPTQ